MKLGRTQEQIRADEIRSYEALKKRFDDWKAGKVVTKFAFFPIYCENTDRRVWLERVKFSYTFQWPWQDAYFQYSFPVWHEIIKD